MACRNRLKYFLSPETSVLRSQLIEHKPSVNSNQKFVEIEIFDPHFLCKVVENFENYDFSLSLSSFFSLAVTLRQFSPKIAKIGFSPLILGQNKPNKNLRTARGKITIPKMTTKCIYPILITGILFLCAKMLIS